MLTTGLDGLILLYRLRHQLMRHCSLPCPTMTTSFCLFISRCKNINTSNSIVISIIGSQHTFEYIFNTLFRHDFQFVQTLFAQEIESHVLYRNVETTTKIKWVETTWLLMHSVVGLSLLPWENSVSWLVVWHRVSIVSFPRTFARDSWYRLRWTWDFLSSSPYCHPNPHRSYRHNRICSYANIGLHPNQMYSMKN